MSGKELPTLSSANSGCKKLTLVECAGLSGSSESQLKEITYTCMPHVLKESKLVGQFLQGIRNIRWGYAGYDERRNGLNTRE